MTAFRLSSLRTRLALIAVLALIPALLFLALDAWAVQRQARAAAEADLSRLAQLVAEAYGRQLDEAERLMATTALFSDVRTGDAAACSARLAEVANQVGIPFGRFGVSDLDGNMFCTYTPVTTTVNIADRLWFREAVRTEAFAIGDYTLSRPSNTPTVGLGYPILDAEGNVARVLSFGLQLSQLQAEAGSLPLPGDAVLTITDRNGAVLARTPGGAEWIGQVEMDPLLQHTGAGAAAGAAAGGAEVGGAEVVEARGVDGVTRLYASVPVLGPSGAEVWLSIGRTPDVVYQEVWTSTERNLFGVATMLLAMLAAIWVGSDRLILRKIDRLAAAGRQLAAGDLHARAPVGRSGDELDQLAQTINQMADSLLQRQAEVLERARHLQLALDELRAAQERAEQAAALLEVRVLERTAELERSNRELNQFAYVASHDLKAPLRAIETLSGWIAQDAGPLLPPESAAHLAKLQGRVRRMDQLLDDLLAYSRAGRIRPPSQRVDVDTLVQDITAMLAPPPGFEVSVVGPTPVLYTPRASLELVLRNLIGNAIKHHGGTAGRIVVRCEPEEPDAGLEAGPEAGVGRNSLVCFRVTDDGPGIDPQYHVRIFEMFQTLNPRDKVEGSGMGLAIVKKLVESYGGTICVDSAVGQGATFAFTWPQWLSESTPVG